MRLMITGGCGFLGTGLAQRAISLGHKAFLVDDLSRKGSEKNLEYLRGVSPAGFLFTRGDVSDAGVVRSLIQTHRPEAVFHLAGQVAMTTSLRDPRRDFLVNAGGALNVLEAVREFTPSSPVLFSSTNKVYGDLEQFNYVESDRRYVCIDRPDGFDESTPLDFASPYGCSKGAADQYMLDYHRSFGLKTVVFRHSSMYGPNQHATIDQGWIGWFCSQALLATDRSEPFTISGSGKQVRDILHIDDMVALYFKTLERIEVAKGHAFNIGGGMANSLSLLELLSELERICGKSLCYRRLEARQSDQRVFVADLAKASSLLDWAPTVGTEAGLRDMVRWIASVS